MTRQRDESCTRLKMLSGVMISKIMILIVFLKLITKNDLIERRIYRIIASMKNKI